MIHRQRHLRSNSNDPFVDVVDSYSCDYSTQKATFDKDATFKTWMHYSDDDAGKEKTVFGSARSGLFYNYSDRLFGDDWRAGEALAKKSATPATARWYEIVLNHFHNTDDVNLQHVILGVNRSTGYSYLIFGYTYTEKRIRK